MQIPAGNIKVKNFELLSFGQPAKDEKTGESYIQQIVIIYALGEDGIIYELTGGKWMPFPIDPENFRKQ